MRALSCSRCLALFLGGGHEAEFLNSVIRRTVPMGYQTQNKRL